MTISRLAAYREALGERFAPDAAIVGRDLGARTLEQLEGALADVAAEPGQGCASKSNTALWLAVQFGASPGVRLTDALGRGVGFDAVAAKLAAPRFGEMVFAGAKSAALLAHGVVAADPIPSLIAAWRRTPLEARALASDFVASAIAALSALAPLIEAGVLELVDADAPDAEAPDPRALQEHAARWASALGALCFGSTNDLSAPIGRRLAGFERLRAAGPGAQPYFAAIGDEGLAGALWAAMTSIAARYDLGRVSGRPTPSMDAMLEARWAQFSGGAADLPRFDTSPSLVWALDIGVAGDVDALSAADAAALRMGEEILALRRDLIAEAMGRAVEAPEAVVARADRDELADQLRGWDAAARAALPALRVGAAFSSPARVSMHAPPGLSEVIDDAAARSVTQQGLVALAAAWPENRLIAELARVVSSSEPGAAAAIEPLGVSASLHPMG